MSFYTSVKNMIDTYGTDVFIKGEKDTKTKAFIQPLRRHYEVNEYIDVGGMYNKNYFLYIGHGVYPLKVGTVISSFDKTYVVHSTQNFVFMNKVLYVWAVLREYNEQRRDDYETD